MSLSDERGFTLVELLVVMTISLILLSATLLTFNSLYQAEHDNDARLDTVEVARNALDTQARQLRNLAKRLNNTPVIDRVTPYDLVFQTSDPSRTWVRYCLDRPDAPASERARLWKQELSTNSTVASSAPSDTACPASSGWTSTQLAADHVTNRRGGRTNRPLFGYACTVGATCTSDPSTYDQVLNVTAQALVDTTPGRGAAEVRVTTGVYLRNQNQPPVASFVTSPKLGEARTVVLNASGSSDYEGRTLNYYWFENTMPAVDAIDCSKPTVTFSSDGSSRTMWGVSGPLGAGGVYGGSGYIGENITRTLTFVTGTAGTTRNIGLVVCDPGDRYGTAGIAITSPIAVQIPN